MSSRMCWRAVALLLAVSMAGHVWADQIKANNSQPLNTGASWVSGVVPGPADVAIFNETLTLSTSANGTAPAPLGGDLSLLGITVAGPVLGQANNQNGIVISNAGSANTLTLGTAGINMGPANAVPMQIQSKVLLGGNQTWNVSDASANITNPAPAAIGTGQTTGSRYSPFGQTHDEDLYFFNQNTTAGVSTIDLGGFTLSKTGNGTVEVNAGYLMTNGAINLNEGTLTVQGGASRNTTINTNTTINIAGGATLRLQSNGNASTFANGTLNLGEGSNVNITTSNSTNNRVSIGGRVNVNGSSLIHLSNQPISGQAQGTPNMPHEISGNLVGSAQLSLRNTATNANALLVLSGDNSGYTGTALLDAGTGRGIIRMTTNTAGSAAANWVINTSNTLQVAGNTSVQLGTLGGTGDIANPTAGTTATVNVGSGEFGGALQSGAGAVALNKIGPGTLVLSGFNVHTGGTSVNGGTLRAANLMPFGDVSGTLTVNTGGTVDLNAHNTLAGTLAGNGGTITNEASGQATLTAGNAGNSTFAGVIRDGAGTVGLNKMGTGQITLTGASTYTGGTEINEGALVANGSLATGGNVVIGGIGSLGGTGRAGNVIMNNGSLRPGASAADTNVGTLTLSSLRVELGDLRLDLPNPAASDRINVVGTADFAGSSTITPTAPPLPGTYTLLQAGTLTGTAPTLVTPGAGTTRSNFTLNFDTAADRITLDVVGNPKNLTWTGANGPAWDFNTVNWSDNGGATTNEKFFNLDSVTFGTGPSNRNVTLDTVVAPGAVTVNNAAGSDYTISGSGSIGDSGVTGGTPLTKTGAGTLTLGTANTYKGPTAIQGGTLRQGTLGAIPAGTRMLIGSANQGATLDLGGFDLTVGMLTSGDGNNVIGNSSTNSPATLTMSGGDFRGVIRDTLGAGNQKVAVVFNGGANYLTGANTYGGGTTINGAGVTLGGVLNSPSTLGAPGSALTMTGGALDLNGNNATFGALNGDAEAVILGGSAGPPVTLTVGDASDASFAGQIRDGSGRVSLVKAGAGTLTLVGPGFYSGGLTIDNGAVRLGTATSGGTGTITVNNGTTVVTAASLANPITLAGGTAGTSATPITLSGNVVAADGSTSTFRQADPQNLPGAAVDSSEIMITGTLQGGGNINILSSGQDNSADAGNGFRLRGTAPSNYSGTINVGHNVKFELQTAVTTPFSPAGTGKIVMNAGDATLGGALTAQTVTGGYSEINLRNNSGGDATFGNDLAVSGTGLVVLNPLGSAPAGRKVTMGNLSVGAGQEVAVYLGAAPAHVVEFTSVTLNGTATFSPKKSGFGADASVGSDLSLGAIGQTTPSGIVMDGLRTLTLTGTNTYTGPTTVNRGTLRVGGSVAASSGVTVNDTATFDAAASQAVKSLTVRNGGTATVSAGVLKVGDDTMAAPLAVDGTNGNTAKLDVKTGGLIVDHSAAADPAAALASVRGQILAGYSGGTWAGNGITSSAAALDAGKGVGYARSDELGIGDFMGTPVDGSAVVARFTILGDATLDGAVNFADLVRLAQNYNTTDGSSVWARGDFNYDGDVDFQDLVRLAQNYNAALPTAADFASAEFRGDLARAFASVPEPSVAALACLAALTMVRRRRP